jgi:hypothetical protein
MIRRIHPPLHDRGGPDVSAAPYFSKTAVEDRAGMASDLEIQKAAYKMTNDLPLEQICDFSFAAAAGKDLEARAAAGKK